MVIWRRTLLCKVGQTRQVVEASIALGKLMVEADETVKEYRVYTDLSGRTDRVITEIYREELLHPRDASSRVHGRSDLLDLIRQMTPCIESAEVEFLELEASVERSGS